MKRSRSSFLALVAPAFVVYTAFMLVPLIASLGLSFYEWSGYGAKNFVGARNFLRLFSDANYSTRFWNALGNNTYFFVITMLIQNVTALVLAVLLERGLKGSNLFRTIFFAPSTISVVIVGYLWLLIYNPIWGALNKVLGLIGINMKNFAWLGNEGTALTAVAVANAWQYIGIPMMLFISGINTIPEEQYEAVSVDGGGEWHKFCYVTLPNLKPILFIVSTMTFVGNFSSFEIIYAMEGTLGAPNYATDTLGTFFYRTAFGARTGSPPEMGMGAAIAAVMTLIIGVGVVAWLRFNAAGRDD
ncbi:MAG: sugar ABC transporter permease [Clostridiales bacterium]|nr:sugar ABC transporter permease [Bacillota bacterium]NLL55065.1 sugar ABC transporter permease [Clostridiales bacterium]